ncbi:hypothetical protein C0J52_02595 [Blattella germanica]|nr:hypothetical protein C0J52_02595 [Blattella germanica]
MTYKRAVLQMGVETHCSSFTQPFLDRMWEDQHRRTVLDGRAALERTAESLARSHRTAVETEQLGEEVVSELSAQRETLLRSKQRLADTDHELSQTHALLRKMTINVLTNKIILIVIILLEVAILIAVCYIRFFNSRGSEESGLMVTQIGLISGICK